jgi:hypothetical protein
MGRESRRNRERRAREAEFRRAYSDPPVVRYPVRPQASSGITGSERLLAKLARDTFLSLWSYPNVLRAERQPNGGIQGKEIADLVVVFDNDVVLFSDKDCAFGNTGKLHVDWPRWYRKAVEKAAKQLWGAERQLRANPANIFLDPSCQTPLPVRLPAPEQLRIHRVVVAHGASERCAKELGGSGSLVIAPDIVGDEHTTGNNPFAIGMISDSKPFVHVLDDTSLLLLMHYLDTVSDFVGYLRKKEALVLSGRLGVAMGEEALLGQYVGDLNAHGEHDFVLPSGNDKIALREDRWHNFLKSPELQSKLDADRISYMWDALIEDFAGHFSAGTSHFISEFDAPADDFEKVLRFFARENRTRRRLLSESIRDMLASTPPTERRIRVIPPSMPGDPYWLFLLFPFPHHLPHAMTYEHYRAVRRRHLEDCMSVLKLKFADALDIVGFATESGRLEVDHGSEDAGYLDARDWTPEREADAREVQIKARILVNPNLLATSMAEYPVSGAHKKPNRG